jgi:hypothetical protein
MGQPRRRAGPLDITPSAIHEAGTRAARNSITLASCGSYCIYTSGLLAQPQEIFGDQPNHSTLLVRLESLSPML